MKSPARGHIKAGLDSVRGVKGRSFATMLGVIIGVSSVIIIVSIGQGIKNQIGGQIHHLGQNIITVRPGSLQTGNSTSKNLDNLTGVSLSQPLNSHDVEVVNGVKGVADSAPLTVAAGKITGENGAYNGGYVIGTSDSLPNLLNQSLAYGSFWTAGDFDANVAVVGQHAAEQMFNVDVPLGHSFTFHGQQFIVRGLFNQFSNSPVSQQVNLDDAIFIPNDVAESLTNNTAPTYAIVARATGQPAATVADRVRQALDKAHGGQSSFQVLSGNQELANNNNIINLLTSLVGGIAAISLLVGGLGIMNVMQVSVSERLREIGIRKAVGATNRQIMSQFLVESTALSLIGGIIGIAIALLVEVGLRLWTNLQPDISWQIVAIASGVSLAVGIIFGTLPAVKAARKDPILALRSE